MACFRMWSAISILLIILTLDVLFSVKCEPVRERRVKRKRSGSSSSRGVPFENPVDPLFTDQREIRLPFPKDRLWPDASSKKFGPSKSSYAKQEVFPRKEAKKPNIILILTDDQDVELGSLDYMPKTRAILKDAGAFFPNSFVSTPMCCPSRSTLLTGLFVHNHGVLTNNYNCSSAYWQSTHEPRTFGAYLSNAGYRTGYFGKYLNKYNGSYIPQGWREWAGLVSNSRYYNYTINFNGQKIKHGFDYQTDYYPDLITNDSISFIRQSKRDHEQSPFMLVMSFPSPHGPEDAAPQYSNMFFNVTRHRTPSYDFAPNPDKQWVLRWLGKMKPVHQKFTDLLMTKRLQTLQSVDDAVERIYLELVATGQLDNTYIFYTSDHGYHLGQFGLVKGKSFPFETDIRVPFLVRGPGIAPGRVVHSIVGNVDIAPTFLDIAGVPVPPHMDGASIVRFFQKNTKNRAPWRDTYLIERGRIPPSGFDKFSSQSHDDSGEDLSVGELAAHGKFERMAIECKKPQYQSPCNGFQKYQCVLIDGRWKMKPCRAKAPLSSFKIPRKMCKCKADKYRLSKRHPSVRRMQRKYRKKHVSIRWSSFEPKFARKNRRNKRNARSSKNVESTLRSVTESSVLHEVAQDELEQVESIMDDISGDIFQLETLRRNGYSRSVTESNTFTKLTSDRLGESIDSGFQPCKINGRDRINCSSEVYSDPVQWRLSREYFDQQIRILRIQLKEMKVIRRHLRDMKPLNLGGQLQLPKESKDDLCPCRERWSRSQSRRSDREVRQTARRKMKADRLRRKQRKLSRKAALSAKHNGQCNFEKLNCFSHDNSHWRTVPQWTDGPFCVCINANNNSYWCLRTVNSTHNSLYCEFVTGFVTYYDMRVDPFQLRNIAHTLTEGQLNSFHHTLDRMRTCKGADCFVNTSADTAPSTVRGVPS